MQLLSSPSPPSPHTRGTAVGIDLHHARRQARHSPRLQNGRPTRTSLGASPSLARAAVQLAPLARIQRGSHAGLPRRPKPDPKRFLYRRQVENLTNALLFSDHVGHPLISGMT